MTENLKPVENNIVILILGSDFTYSIEIEKEKYGKNIEKILINSYTIKYIMFSITF